MGFISIPQSWINSTKANIQSLWQYVKDNFDYLFGQLGQQATGTLLNSSFEVDSDSDGEPDNWDKNLYPAGSFSLDTSGPVHGAKCAKFTHPGGASNGGGYLDSDYVEVAEFMDYQLSALVKATAASKNQIIVRWYDKAKSYLSSSTVWDNTGSLSWQKIMYVISPPSTACYAKVRLVGGEPTVDAAGDTYFDDVVFRPWTNGMYSAGDVLIASADTERSKTGGGSGYTKVKEIVVVRSGWLRVNFDLHSTATVNSYGRIYINGAAVGTEQINDTTGYITYSENIQVRPGNKVQLYYQATGAYGVYVRNFRIYNTIEVLEAVLLD